MGEARSCHYQWYRTAAVHIYRTFFKFRHDEREPDSEQKQYSFALCEAVLAGFSDFECQFLEDYFSCPWGTDQQVVDRYVAQTDATETTLFRTVFDANRRLFELAGLLEPKA